MLKNKFVRITVGAVLFFGCLYLSFLVYVLSFSLSTNIPEKADAVIVLGAKVNIDNTPSNELYNRTSEGVGLYKQGRVRYLLFTGGVGLGKVAEAETAKKIALQQGVPEDKILVEDISHTTLQNVSEIRPLAKEHGINSVVVISDQYHVARGVFVAKQFGFHPVYWDYPSSAYIGHALLVRNYLREAAALMVYIPKLMLGLSKF
jgi:uncharacterized SAM-binding protein YcdF (DUF218 family)